MGKISKSRSLADNQVKASLRMLRGSPQKLGLVAQAIRGKDASVALDQLTFSKKKVSFDVKKLLLSAIANAENNHGLDIDALYVKEVLVGKSLTMKRIQPRARGRAYRIHKPFSTISIVLEERV